MAWARLEEAEGEAKQQWQEVVDNLESKYDDALAETRKVEEAGADAWDDMRHGFIEAYNDLQDATEEAAAEFEEE